MPQVLVVDDEPRIVDFVSRALAAEGFGVDSASDGHRGLQMARTGRYELVVLDRLLPGKDGVSVLEDLMEARPQQRVLVLSALSDVENKVRCLEPGASATCAVRVGRAGCSRARQASATGVGAGRAVRCGGVTLDLVGRTADPGTGAVALSERAFLLLRYLIHTRGAVSTREQLLSGVWGYSFDPGSNVVDVCVGRLRAKLGAEAIETVRNVGYRFNAS